MKPLVPTILLSFLWISIPRPLVAAQLLSSVGKDEIFNSTRLDGGVLLVVADGRRKPGSLQQLPSPLPPPPSPPPPTGGRRKPGALSPPPPAGQSGWEQLPHTQLQSVCPPNNYGNITPPGWFFDACHTVISAWGSAVLDTARNR
ncbi:MAG: hypothetical protein AB7P18_35180, partial [Candidatus Binatia bacterium]